MALVVTGFYTALLTVLIIWLGFVVIKLRMKYQVSLLDGGQIALAQAIRAHANAIEWVPMIMLLFACAESQGLATSVLHALGSGLVVARILHAYGLSHHAGESFGRLYGMIGTWGIALILVGCNFFSFLRFYKLID